MGHILEESYRICNSRLDGVLLYLYSIITVMLLPSLTLFSEVWLRHTVIRYWNILKDVFMAAPGLSRNRIKAYY